MTPERRRYLNPMLRARIEGLAHHLYPSGQRQGPSWRFEGMDINLRTGWFGDWTGWSATCPQMEKNLINLWQTATGTDFENAVEEIEAWLNVPKDDSWKTEPIQEPEPPKNRQIRLPLLERPNGNFAANEHTVCSEVFCEPVNGERLVKSGHVTFITGGDCL